MMQNANNSHLTGDFLELHRHRAPRAAAALPFQAVRARLRPALFEKAAAGAADVVCMDLEDAVAPSDKNAARDNIVAALNDVDWGGKLVTVRVNGLDTDFCYRDVLALVEKGGERLDAIMIPKVGKGADVYAIDMLITQASSMSAAKRRSASKSSSRPRSASPTSTRSAPPRAASNRSISARPIMPPARACAPPTSAAATPIT